MRQLLYQIFQTLHQNVCYSIWEQMRLQIAERSSASVVFIFDICVRGNIYECIYGCMHLCVYVCGCEYLRQFVSSADK